MQKAVAGEFLGTALMVGVGCGSVALGASHLAVSLTFGAVVTLAILLFGPWSGAHINPAVSLAFWRSGDLPSNRLLPYWLAQCTGALLASWTVQAAAPTTVSPSLTLLEGFLIEVGITALLMLSIFAVLRRTEHRVLIAAWVGGTVAVLAFLAGPLTGASMNPARTFGPNLLSGMWATLPFFFVSTALGAWLAVDLDRRLHRLR
jgi:glycerol uptake facilitator-like aquaporin